jgi:hypothetical protein
MRNQAAAVVKKKKTGLPLKLSTGAKNEPKLLQGLWG